MTRELSKTEKALRLIAKEDITAKEAAERVGISPAAVSKGRLWPSKTTQNIRKLCEMENEIESLRSELATITRQRDLAVEAVPTFVAEFARFVGGDGEFWLHELEDFLDTWKKMQDYTIKRSEKT